MNETWYLYIIENKLGQLYTGICKDVEKRFEEHSASGKRAAKALKGKGPLALRFSTLAGDHSAALKLEYKIKRLSRADKLSLINGTLALTSFT